MVFRSARVPEESGKSFDQKSWRPPIAGFFFASSNSNQGRWKLQYQKRLQDLHQSAALKTRQKKCCLPHLSHLSVHRKSRYEIACLIGIIGICLAFFITYSLHADNAAKDNEKHFDLPFCIG